ncbi:MAG TPA: oxidoreductase [Candidatus Gracilibacteria bacterium]
MKNKNQKVIFITGASSGIGKETALKLIEEGYIVYGAARSIGKMQDLIAAGGQALEMDITKDDQIRACVEEVVRKEGQIDVLINNAGFGLYGAVEDVPIDEARYQFEVNLFGLGRITQLVLPHMREAQSGTIINISSMGGKIYTPLGAWYHATKHAVEGFSDCLRLETKPFNIDVVIIEPGVISTEFANVMMDPMLKRSGDGAYSDLAKRMAKSTEKAYKKGNGSPFWVISNTILKAIQSKRPKTRYVVGKWAKPMMFVRKYFGDRIFDALLLSQIK